jgi:hypothetical protein
MEQSFQLTFANGRTAQAIHLQQDADLPDALNQLGLEGSGPVLVVVGGASKLSDADRRRVQALFVKVLAPLAKDMKAFVVDGGTDAGIMRLMGEARTQINAAFPLIGVAPIGLATLPNASSPVSDEASLLEPNHTHFALVPGSSWGDESPWIAKIASTLADFHPSIVVLINGGEVTWRDASQNIQEGRPVVVIAGSGRTADVLAAVLRGKATDQRAEDLISSGLVKAIDLTTDFRTLFKQIKQAFLAKG